PAEAGAGDSRSGETRSGETRSDETRPYQAGQPGGVRPYQAGEPGEPDELFRAWQGSVRQASSGVRPRTKARRRRAWQVARVGVPAVVIVAVGAGALMMLTGKTNEMLAHRANQGNPAPSARSS